MSEIARSARASKTTLYSRFPSKSAIFRAIVEEQIKSWDNSGLYHTPIPDLQTLEETLLAYGDIALRAGMTVDFIQINRLLYSESGRFPELAEIASKRLELGVRYLAEQIAKLAVREGIPCTSPERAAEQFLILLFGWSNMAVLSNRTVTPTERENWLKTAVRAFLGGRSAW